VDRAAFLSGAFALAAAPGSATAQLAELEGIYGGRLGVVALDVASGVRIAHRPDERFPMCGTFNVLLAGAVLARVDAGAEHPERLVPYGKADLLEPAPITKERVGLGLMTVRDLGAAAIAYGDTTAANLLLRAIGGPSRVTGYARSLGDARTRLDRNEPGVNGAIPGDERDTTTPAAMAADLRRLVAGRALSETSRRALVSWLIDCKTGLDAIRFGVPASWNVGDKTGSGDHATVNDVAVLFPPKRSPIVLTAYYTGSPASSDVRHGVLAEVGRLVSTALA
jgi:beta-lactamase class A